MKKAPISLFGVAIGILTIAGSSGIASTTWSPAAIQPGIAPFTCVSSFNQPGDPVFAMVDLRDPVGCGAPPIPASWTAAAGPPREYMHLTWTKANLGEVFGVDVDSGSTSHVFVSAMGPKPIVAGWTFPSRRGCRSPAGRAAMFFGSTA
ncbi:MAG: hypothetical protein R3F11_00675 [Verrucomicrobiales bacterium]